MKITSNKQVFKGERGDLPCPFFKIEIEPIKNGAFLKKALIVSIFGLIFYSKCSFKSI